MALSVATIGIDRIAVSAYTVPTDSPESDGTLAWNSTTMILVEVAAGGETGLGYTYGDPAVAALISGKLAGVVEGCDALFVGGSWSAMVKAIRNLGRPGICSMAIAAVDVALWDLKAKLLGLPLFKLLDAAHDSVPIYGSGGFTSYSVEKLQQQLGGWVQRGISRVKMKVGTSPEDDSGRVRAAREAVGRAELFADANGAYSRKQALAFAEQFAVLGVSWFEEPVSSDDLEGLRLIRNEAPRGMEIAAGEYGYDAHYFRRMLQAGAVDVLQADATRCAGITGFLQAASLCESRSVELSAHTAPSLHAHACCAVKSLRHLEYFHDHARIEHMLFDGALDPDGGVLTPDPDRPGLGIEFKHRDAQRYAV